MLAPRRNVTRRHRHERTAGQMIVAFALMFGFFMFGLIVAVIDLAALYGQQSQIAKAAQDGAVAGAANIDIGNFRTTGLVKVCGAGGTCTVTSLYGPGPLPGGSPAGGPCAQAIKTDLGAVSGVTLTCAYPVAGPGPPVVPPGVDYEITATVQRTVQLPIPLGVSTVIVKSSYSALAQCGTTTASATCN